jgi:prepilin-type N-terminal cleavage/methylation domain-containing protein
MIKKLKKTGQDQQGFTIVELLVSSLIFSLILLVVTVGIIQISRVYYKGITESTTQNTARSIVDTVSQAIQFNGGAVSTTLSPAPGTWSSFCVGSQQFSYRLGYQLVEGAPSGNQTNKALLQTPLAGCSGNPAAATTGRELLGTKMRISKLTVASAGTNMYRVSIRIAYGDDDLLDNPTSTTASCKGATAGSQFCSISELTTTVVKRVQ